MNMAATIRAIRLLALCLGLLGCTLSLDGAAADPLAPKAFAFACATSLLSALGLMKPWWGEPLRLPRGRLAWSLGLLALAGWLSFTLSPSKPGAAAAWQALLLCLLFLLAALDLLAEPGARAWALRGLAFAALAAGALSLAMALGLPTGLPGQGSFAGRVGGSFGNPNFAGGFFVLCLPVLLHQALSSSSAERALFIPAALLSLIGAGLSGSKAVLLGLLLAAAAAGHLLFWSGVAHGRRKRPMAWLAGGVAACLLLGFLALPPDAGRRMFSGWGPGSESVRFRAGVWQGSLRAVAARPLLGWGPGCFSSVYPAFRDPATLSGNLQHSYEVGHAENWVLQAGVELGLFGLAALAFLLLSVLKPLRERSRAWETDLDSRMALALLCSLLASLAVNLAGLDLFLPSSLLPFLLLLAMAAELGGAPSVSLSLNAKGWAKVMVSLGLCFLALVPPAIAWLKWQASRDLASAQALSMAGRFDEAVRAYEKALVGDPHSAQTQYFLGQALQDRNAPGDLALAEAQFAALRRQAPDYVLVHDRLGHLYSNSGRLREAEGEWKRQLELDPWYRPSLQALASLLAKQGRLKEAAEVLEQGLARFPGDPDMQRNLAAVKKAMILGGHR